MLVVATVCTTNELLHNSSLAKKALARDVVIALDQFGLVKLCKECLWLYLQRSLLLGLRCVDHVALLQVQRTSANERRYHKQLLIVNTDLLALVFQGLSSIYTSRAR